MGQIDDQTPESIGQTISQKTVVITGGNAGIGKESAIAIASMGARVMFTSRDAQRGADALSEVKERSGSTKVELLSLDLASLASIRSFATTVMSATDRIDVLLNNAGLLQTQRSMTVDGFETTFGVNHLGHFLLTDLLGGILTKTAKEFGESRVVAVASNAHKFARNGVNFDDLERRKNYSGMGVYGESKLANILFANELAKRLSGSGVTANSLHPGYVASRFGRDGDTGRLDWAVALGAQLFAISPKKGAATSVFVATDQSTATASGGYYEKSRLKKPTSQALDTDAQKRLWEVSTELVNR
ncbi:MAG: SDR family oxidoreductase [Acidimicrobiia bacterium]|nr:SDR family oxidoreductase [Acidimicrobiia bacterium]